MTDILLSGFDMEILNGDLLTGTSDTQHEELLLMTFKGEWREYPRHGIGLPSMLKEEDRGQLYGIIKTELEKDNRKVIKIEMISGKLNIASEYATN